MPYTIGDGYTTTTIKCYPLDSSGPTITHPSVGGWGPWVEIIPSNTVTVDFTLLAVVSFIDPTVSTDIKHQVAIRVGMGASGSESAVAYVTVDYFIDTAAGHCMELVIPLYPLKIPANSRVALSCASDIANAVFGGCKVVYVEALDTYTDELIKLYPTMFGVYATSSATDWAWGSWVELVPVNTITKDFDVCAIQFLFPPSDLSKDVRYQGVIQLGIGLSGNEVPIISLPVTFLSDTLVNHVPEKQIYTLPIPRRVPANSRVAVRVANSGAVALTWGRFNIRYIEGPVPAIVETIIAKSFPMEYLEKPVKAEELRSKVEGATITVVAKDFPLEMIKAGKAKELRSKWS